MSYSLALLFGQLERAEMESAAPRESLTPTCLQHILRDHSEELWHLFFLHFVSGHHHPEVEFPINYLSVFLK